MPDAISELRDLAYAAALDDTLWRGWVERVAAVTGAVGGLFAVQDERLAPLRGVVAAGRVGELIDDYVREWGALDPTLRPLEVLDGSAIFTSRDYRICDEGGRAYRDWEATTHRLGAQAVSVAFLAGGKLRAGFSLLRDVDAGPFEPAQLAILARLFPAMAHAMRLGQQHAAMLVERWWEGAAGARGEAALLLDEDGGMRRATPAALALRRAADGLALVGGRLRAARPEDDDALVALVARAVAPVGAAAGTIRIGGPGAPRFVVALPLARARRLLAPYEAAALVRIVDPRRPPPALARHLREAFGLGARETALVDLLLAGHSAESAAAHQGVALATVRSQLRSIFAKTGTSRQGELLALAARLAPALIQMED